MRFFRKQHNFDAISVMPANFYNPEIIFIQPKVMFYLHLLEDLQAKRDSIPEVVCWGSGNQDEIFFMLMT